ncbi:MAG: hypothetical protein HUU17_10650 [Chthonomonadales bacterium]|nr:hypothetical protein [Chthonomonadales bacterium]
MGNTSRLAMASLIPIAAFGWMATTQLLSRPAAAQSDGRRLAAADTNRRGSLQQTRKAAPVDVSGSWSGDWGSYTPPPPGLRQAQPPGLGQAQPPMYPDACKPMDCTVVKLGGGRYQATFAGECGRPYKYTIKMTGRTVGSSVLFKGSADLGEKDGGVFDWIGRATDKEFVGFFTSQGYTGTFRLERR